MVCDRANHTHHSPPRIAEIRVERTLKVVRTTSCLVKSDFLLVLDWPYNDARISECGEGELKDPLPWYIRQLKPQFVFSSISSFHWSRRARGAIIKLVLHDGFVERFFTITAILNNVDLRLERSIDEWTYIWTGAAPPLRVDTWQ